MSRLIVDELITELVQEFKVSSPINLASIRPWIYSHNNPSGNFNLSLYRDGNLLKSFPFTNSELKIALNVTEAYFHGRYAIASTPFILNRGTYELKLSASGYVYDTNSFLGWCKDLNPNCEVYGVNDNYTSNPYSFTLISYKNREL